MYNKNKIIEKDKEKNNDINNKTIQTINNLCSTKIKTKYIDVSKTINTEVLNSILVKIDNSIIKEKQFIGYTEDDSDELNKMSSNTDINLIVKNKSLFNDNIISKKSLINNSQVFIGHDEDNLENLNIDTILHIKGDTEINGNIYVYNDINTDNNLYVEKSVNIGFDKINSDNTSKLNVNGNSEFIGDSVLYGSQYIKNNLFCNNKAYLNKDLVFTNSLVLKEENINNINYDELTIDNYNYLLSNVVKNIIDENKENSGIKFYSKQSTDLASSIISVNKKFLFNNDFINVFLLAMAVHFNSTILSAKPLNDTITLIYNNKKSINIGDKLEKSSIVENNAINIDNIENIEKINNTDSTEKNIENTKSNIKEKKEIIVEEKKESNDEEIKKKDKKEKLTSEIKIFDNTSELDISDDSYIIDSDNSEKIFN